MRPAFSEYLACPECYSDLRAAGELEGDHILAGTLACTGCEREYPIIRGVPRMNREMQGLEDVARSFGYEWKQHHAGTFESDTLFGRTREQDWAFFLECMGITEDAVKRSIALDAGCGSGRFTRLIGEHGAAAAIGMDINEAVDEAFEDCRDLPNVHIVQGNIFAPPFKQRTFDLIWCNGVLHHTPDARKGHGSLARLVKSGGTLYVWVYPKRFNPFRFTKTVLEKIRVTRLPESVLVALAKTISYPSFGLLQLYRLVRTLPPLRPKTAWGKRTVRPRSLPELQLTWFDAISPEYDTRHTDDEVIEWFEREGFENITALEEPKVGVRGRVAVQEGEPAAITPASPAT